MSLSWLVSDPRFTSKHILIEKQIKRTTFKNLYCIQAKLHAAGAGLLHDGGEGSVQEQR